MTTHLIGQTILDQYRIDSFIASGGMGAVYRVWDLDRNVPLAMKVLHEDFMDDPVVMKSFQREARALERLAHPNIVPFYGMGESQGFAFLLARFIDGPSLKTILRDRGEKPLSIPESLAYLKAVSAALGYAHRNGVVHCDVKPGNIMIDQGGSIFLTDFGIARHAESTKTSFGGAVGTAYYMAPEQFMEREVTPATDVYALAVVFYEMITGQRPFTGEEGELGTTSGATRRSMLMHAHLRLPPPDPRSIQPDIPAALSSVLRKALDKDPRERYHTTQEFFMAVCEAAASHAEAIPDRIQAPEGYEPVSPPPEPVQQPFPSGVKMPARSLGIWIAAGVFLIALVVVLLIGTRAVDNNPIEIGSEVGSTMVLTPGDSETLAQGEPTEIRTELIYTQAAMTLEAELTQEAKTNKPSPTPSKVPTRTSPPPSPTPWSKVQSVTRGEWIVFSFGEKQYERDLYRLDLNTGREEQLTTNGRGNISPVYSPDGRKIAFVSCRPDCDLYIMDMQTLAEHKLHDFPFKVMFPDWCRDPDKPWIVFEGREDSAGDNVWMINVDTGDSEKLTNGKTDYRPVWSPDCSQVIFGRENRQYFGDIMLFDLTTGQESQLTRTPDWDEFNFSWSPTNEWVAFCRVSGDTNGDGHVNLNDRSRLLIMKPDGSGERALTGNQYSVFSPSWSPQGDKILFQAYFPNRTNGEFWIYTLKNQEFEQLTSRDYYFHPQWSP